MIPTLNPSLFSQSMISLGLKEAVAATAQSGYEAIELACCSPHFSLDRARTCLDCTKGLLDEAGLKLAGLSLFTSFTDSGTMDEEIRNAIVFLKAAPVLGTTLVKITPGGPSSAEATEEHWSCFMRAIDALKPVARELGVRLAFETHMRQLTDTLAGCYRLLESTTGDTIGLTVDFCNLAFAHETLNRVMAMPRERIWHVHLKNGTVGPNGEWSFLPLDTGVVNVDAVLQALSQSSYEGYVSLECLQPEARQRPLETAARDLRLLREAWARVVAGTGG